jgi:hypothetical protein
MTTSTLAVTVNPVADAPTLTVSNATGNEDTAIALVITPAVTDSSEHISSLTIGGAPAGAVLSDGTPSHTVTVVGTPVDVASWNLGNLTIKPPANSDADFVLTVTATSQDGVGLGLPIALAVAQAHAGSIHVDSRPGEGAVFALRVPVDGPPEPEA